MPASPLPVWRGARAPSAWNTGIPLRAARAPLQCGATNGTISDVAVSIDDLIADMRANPVNVRFTDACKVADHFFGKPTQHGTSHRVWKMPWPGNPRVNMQDDKGKAKAYQVRQLLEAIERHSNVRRAIAEETAPASAGLKKGKRRSRK